MSTEAAINSRRSLVTANRKSNVWLVLAWMLVGIQIMAVVGNVIDRDANSISVRESLGQCCATGVAAALGSFLGWNMPALAAMVYGIVRYWQSRTHEFKRLCSVAGVVLLVSAMVQLV